MKVLEHMLQRNSNVRLDSDETLAELLVLENLVKIAKGMAYGDGLMWTMEEVPEHLQPLLRSLSHMSGRLTAGGIWRIDTPPERQIVIGYWFEDETPEAHTCYYGEGKWYQIGRLYNHEIKPPMKWTELLC